MSEHEPITSSDEVQQLKESILDKWRLLPPDEKAAVIIEQLRDVLDSKLGEPVRQELAVEEDSETDPLEKLFPLTSVSRADLKQVYFPQETIEQLSDNDMEAIARIMEDAYVEASFWGDLEYAAGKLLEEKRDTIDQQMEKVEKHLTEIDQEKAQIDERISEVQDEVAEEIEKEIGQNGSQRLE